MAEPIDLSYKPPTAPTQEHSPALDEVSTHLNGISLNDPLVQPTESIHREIQTDDLPVRFCIVYVLLTAPNRTLKKNSPLKTLHSLPHHILLQR